jgi:hypothetical protein
MAPLVRSTVIALLASAVAGHGGVWNYSIAGDWRLGYVPPSTCQTGHVGEKLC